MMQRLLAAVAVVAAISLQAASPGESNVARVKLPNGLRVVVVRNPLAPVVTTELNYLVGADETPPGFPGMAHAQEHMMFRSSTGLSTGQLANIFAAMGGGLDADTQNTVTQFITTAPAADLDIVLHIESIRMRGVLDAADEWAQERGAIEQEVSRDLSSPFYKFYSTALANMFAGTPYAHDALGTRPSFERTTAQMLKSFYNTWYHPNNAVLVITGDVDLSSTLVMVQKYFGAIPRASLPPRQAVVLRQPKPASIELTSDLPVPVTLVAYRFPGYNSADYAAAEVLSNALGSTRGDLYNLTVTGKAIAAGFFPAAILPKAGSALMYGFPQSGDTRNMLATLEGIASNYALHGVPADLVDASRRQLVAQTEFNQNSISGLADRWSEALAVEGLSSPDDEVAALMKVTKADVDRVALRYLVNKTAVVGILTPQPSGKPLASRGFGGQESFTPAQTANASLPDWASAMLTSLNVPQSSVSPTDVTLPNKLHLIVQPETVTPTVTLIGRVKSDPNLQTPPGKEGVSGVLDQLFSFGTETLDRVAFQEALDDIAASESAGSEFSLTVLSSDFDRGVELLADNELHPALPQTNFLIVRSQLAYTLRGELQSPDYLTNRALNQGLYPKDDPIQREATPDTVGALSLSDVKDYYQKAFRPDLTTIVVIGDVIPDQVQSSIAKWFGAWSTSGPKPQTDLPSVPANSPSSVTVPNASRVQDGVTLAETVGISRDDPDYYALEVGDHVLGGGFYATRLYRDVRQQAGLAYEVSNSLNVGKTRSMYTISYGCDPQNVSKVRGIVVRDVQAMQTSQVTPTELQLAKALLLHEIPLRESSEESIASGLLERTVAGLPLNEVEVSAQRFVAVTAPQIQAAFSKWIRPDGFVQVVQGPPPR